jgi:LPXTG-motif cell wall-anchored protein
LAAGPVPQQEGSLPATGTSSWVMALLAFGLMLAGSGFVGLARRNS